MISEKKDKNLPDKFGRYLLDEFIGSGGTASVFRAHDDNHTVALKMLHSHLSEDPVILERFIREARISREFTHPHIVPIYDIIQWEDNYGLVMEYCTGGNLAGWRCSNWDDIRTIISQLADALQYSHDKGVIHRDIKPHNVLQSKENTFKLCDFGSAHIHNLIGLTSSSIFMGTPQYIPPETLRGYPPEPRTDLYAIGAMLYEFCTGRSHINSPLPNPDWTDKSSSIKEPQHYNDSIPHWLNELIMTLIGPIHYRPRNARELKSILELKLPRTHEKTKTCLHCNEDIPIDSPFCFFCGTEEIFLDRDQTFQHYSVIIREISEDASVMERLRQLLITISGDPSIELNVITGDARLYSKEEKSRLLPLPLVVVKNVSWNTAEKVQTLIEDIGVEAAIKQSKNKHTPLLSEIPRKITLPLKDELMRSLTDNLQLLPHESLRFLIGNIFFTFHRIKQQRPSTPVVLSVTGKESLESVVLQSLEKLVKIEGSLSDFHIGTMYNKLLNLDGKIQMENDSETLDALMKERTQIKMTLQHHDSIEKDRSILINQLLQILHELDLVLRKTTTEKEITSDQDPWQ